MKEYIYAEGGPAGHRVRARANFCAKRAAVALRLRYFLALLAVAAVAAPLASQTTKVRAVNASGEGLKGIVLVVDRGDQLAASAIVTDANGIANVPSPQCALCVISAFDPKGLYYPATAEFAGRSPSVDVQMQVRPVIDTAFTPRVRKLEIIIEGLHGEPIAGIEILVRPAATTFAPEPIVTAKTGANGIASLELGAGTYVVAAVVGRIPQEFSFTVSASGKIACAGGAGCSVRRLGVRQRLELRFAE